MLKTNHRLRVLIIGHGEMGHALQSLLQDRHELHIWQRRPASGTDRIDPVTEIPRHDIVLFCVPATALPELAERFAPAMRNSATTCLTLAKGLSAGSRLPYDVLVPAWGAHRTVVLYGPMIAEEILAGKPAFAQCGSLDPEPIARIQGLFAESALRVSPSADVIGLSWSVILKNVYTLAFGMADELALGDNVRGFLAVRALDEISHIVASLGGAAETPYRLAGLGDLITTVTSAGSHHYALGRQLAQGVSQGLAGEALHTLAELRLQPRFDVTGLPLFRLIDSGVQDTGRIGARMAEWLRAPFESDQPG